MTNTLRGAAVGSGLARVERWQNRDYLVLPVIGMIDNAIVKAMNAAGPERVPLSEFTKTLAQWEGRPLFLGHPLRQGRPVVAAAAMAEAFGECRFPVIKDGKLCMEAWMDVERSPKELIERARANDQIQISIGALVRTEPVEGLDHVGIWRDVVPDHLALLPSHVAGACNFDMGCGVRAASADARFCWPDKTGFDDRNMAADARMRHAAGLRDAYSDDQERGTDGKWTSGFSVMNVKMQEVSHHASSKDAMAAATAHANTSSTIAHVFDHAGVNRGDSKPGLSSTHLPRAHGFIPKGRSIVNVKEVYRESYGVLAALGFGEQFRTLWTEMGLEVPEDPMEKTGFQKLVTAFAKALGVAETVEAVAESVQQMEAEMTKCEVEKLLANATPEQLKAAADALKPPTAEEIKAAADLKAAAEKKVVDDKAAADLKVATDKAAATVVAIKATGKNDRTDEALKAMSQEQLDAFLKTCSKPVDPTFEELLAKAPADVRVAINGAVSAAAARKTDAIKTLIDSKRCDLTETRLKAMSQEELDALVKLAGVKTTETVDYSGQGGPRAAALNSGTVAAAPDLGAALKAAQVKK